MSLDIKRSEGKKEFNDEFDRHMDESTPEEKKRFVRD